MPDTAYILVVFAITFSITFALRAVPFAVLGTLKESILVQQLSRWMPVGVMGILAVTAFRGSVIAFPGTILYAFVALAITIAAHLLCGRRTLLSVTLGTAAFIILVNLL
jgi:branched-subunit amino acid transport protein AzlD